MRFPPIDGWRAVASLGFGIALWIAIVAGLTGKACGWWSITIWLDISALFGFIYWIPIIGVASAGFYGLVSRLQPARRGIVATVSCAVVLAVFTILAIIVSYDPKQCHYL